MEENILVSQQKYQLRWISCQSWPATAVILHIKKKKQQQTATERRKKISLTHKLCILSPEQDSLDIANFQIQYLTALYCLNNFIWKNWAHFSHSETCFPLHVATCTT